MQMLIMNTLMVELNNVKLKASKGAIVGFQCVSRHSVSKILEEVMFDEIV